jgi:phosphotransferase system HPr (HPr) family protein
MYAKRVVLANSTGFHVRPATLFTETANRFRSTVRVLKEAQAADGKSAISLMLLEAGQGTELTIEANGDDEIAMVDALVDLIDRQFGEAQNLSG